jgi:hypothetical protein
LGERVGDLSLYLPFLSLTLPHSFSGSGMTVEVGPVAHSTVNAEVNNTHARAHTHTHTFAQTRTRTHTQTHTHTNTNTKRVCAHTHRSIDGLVGIPTRSCICMNNII